VKGQLRLPLSHIWVERERVNIMYLTIENKEYQIEFTFEASLCSECTQKVVELMTGLAANAEEGATEEERRKAVSEMIESMTNVPDITLTMFYAGLLEHHGIDGDGTVPDKRAAKILLKKYFAEHKEDGSGNAFDLMNLLMEQMGKDDFFRQIGLTQMMEAADRKAEVITAPARKRKAGNQ